ncbi:hypothetical protein D9757_005901 [Collybiopsis confluens]|uniref:Transmembrane protein n=1 Tax=Collybiopsis confluens TaxID=2823264 RepID=A0A8H5M9P5_9AGAR|nr:hypothetical protein D9757_005901 [Collybiopsis confluens]
MQRLRKIEAFGYLRISSLFFATHVYCFAGHGTIIPGWFPHLGAVHFIWYVLQLNSKLAPQKDEVGSLVGLFQLALRVSIFKLDKSSSSFLHDFTGRLGADAFSLPILERQSLLLCSSRNRCETLSLTTTTALYTPATINLPTPALTSPSGMVTSIVHPSPTISLVSSIPAATFRPVPSASSSASLTVLTTSIITATSSGPSTSIETIFASQSSSRDHGGGGGQSGHGGFRNPKRSNFLPDASQLSTECVGSLSFPVYRYLSTAAAELPTNCSRPLRRIDNALREDIALIILQIWVLCITLVALKYRSISWTITVFICLIFQISWSIFRIVYTDRSRTQFDSITRATCGGESLFPSLWKQQTTFEIPSIILGFLGLMILVYLAYKLYAVLIRPFTFYRSFVDVHIQSSSWEDQRAFLGTSEGRWTIGLHVVIQISMFFVMLPLGLWLNDLFNGVSAHLAEDIKVLKAFALIETLVLLPWLVGLWCSSHQGNRRTQFLLSIASLLYIVALDMVPISEAYRLVFHTWPFFATTAVLSIILCLGLLITGLGVSLKRRINTAVISPYTYSKRESLSADSVRSVRSNSSTQPSLSHSSKRWTDVESVVYSDVGSFSTHTSEEAYRGLIAAKPSVVFPPIDTQLKRQLTGKEDSPTLKTPRSRHFKREDQPEMPAPYSARDPRI